MKKLCLTALVAISINAGAQYFQHTYGNADHEFASSGVNTTVQGQGHFMSGHSRLTCVYPTSTVPVVFSDMFGDIPGAPYFAQNFILARDNGDVVHANQTKSFELDNGNGFGIVGSYTDPNQAGPGNSSAYYMQLDPSGNMVSIIEYNVSGYSLGVNGICESALASGNEIYITGGASDFTNSYPFVLKIDVNTGAILWGYVYDIPRTSSSGAAVCESPYAPYSVDEIVVVGGALDLNSTPNQNDAFLMHIDAATGALLANANIYGSSTVHDYFNSIRVANNTASGPAGFIIGGSTNGGSFDAWVVNTDPLGNINWSSAFDNSITTGSGYNICNDVIERLNTSGDWEYYAVGSANNGIGNDDVQVIKIDETGNGVVGGEFTYGGAFNDEGIMADQYNIAGTLPPDGLSVYGWYSGGIYADMLHVKAYFNGVSGCNEQFNNPVQMSAPGLLTSVSVSQVTSLHTGTMDAAFVPMGNTTLCYSDGLADGNNARVAPAAGENGDKAMVVMPNPAQAGAKAVMVEVESDMPGNAQVTIVDMLGKQYYKGSYPIIKGKNQLPLDISNTNMAAGIYMVKINGTTLNKTTLLLIK